MKTLTSVRVRHIENKVNVWLPFGRSVKERRISANMRDVYFAPHAIFCCISWYGDSHHTQQWRAEVLRAVETVEAQSELENVQPGAEILLRVCGNSRVPALLRLFSALEQGGTKLAAVPSEYWRGVHNRLASGQAVDAHRYGALGGLATSQRFHS